MGNFNEVKFDTKKWDDIKKKMSNLDHTITAGVHEEDSTPYPDNPDVTTAQNAVFQEFGTVKMSARPFIKPGVEDDSIKQKMAKGAEALITGGRSETDVLWSVAPFVEQQIRNRIRSKNILDTGLLTQTVSAKVKNKE